MPTSTSRKSALFLDRDGVINRRLPEAYVLTVDAFEWLPGVLEALAISQLYFDYFIIVTNQQGIGKGLMSEADLDSIHSFLKATVREHGGRIDAIYHCPMLRDQPNNCRKPEKTMGEWAISDFPDIDLSHSYMIGDTHSDMLFGKNMGMRTVFVRSVWESLASPEADEVTDSLFAWVNSLAIS